MKTMVGAIRFLFIMTLITGAAYPLVITGIASLLFSKQARGSIIIHKNRALGSELIAQKFIDEKYFRPRPSAVDYSTVPSGGSNLGTTSAQLKKNFDERKKYWDAVIEKYSHNEGRLKKIPSDVLFSSGSGIDPHISPDAARMQADRIAAVRKFSPEKKKKLQELVEKKIERPILGLIGEPRVNVLLLNLELDKIK